MRLLVTFHRARCLLLLLTISPTKSETKVCPDVPTKEDFDLSKMVGVWNEISILPNQWESGRCIRMTISQIDDKGQASIRWEQIMYMKQKSPFHIQHGLGLSVTILVHMASGYPHTFKPLSTLYPGSMEMVATQSASENSTISYALSHVTANSGTSASKMSLFFTQPYIPWPTPFWVLGTDYVNFALIYSCSEVYDENSNSTVASEMGWIMAREREMSLGQKALFKLYLSFNGVDIKRLTDVDQSRCDAYDQ